MEFCNSDWSLVFIVFGHVNCIVLVDLTVDTGFSVPRRHFQENFLCCIRLCTKSDTKRAPSYSQRAQTLVIQKEYEQDPVYLRVALVVRIPGPLQVRS